MVRIDHGLCGGIDVRFVSLGFRAPTDKDVWASYRLFAILKCIVPFS